MAEKVKGWRTDPGVGRCKRVSDETGAEMVIVIQITDAGQIEGHSYGRTREMCDFAGQMMDAGMDAMLKWAGEQP